LAGRGAEPHRRGSKGCKPLGGAWGGAPQKKKRKKKRRRKRKPQNNKRLLVKESKT